MGTNAPARSLISAVRGPQAWDRRIIQDETDQRPQSTLFALAEVALTQPLECGYQGPVLRRGSFAWEAPNRDGGVSVPP